MTFDRSPQILRFKMMAGNTLIQEFAFFDISDPTTANITFDISNFNFRVTGRLLGNNLLIQDFIFDANVAFGNTGTRNGLWLVQDALKNKMYFFHDWVTDSAQLENAPEGVFEFKLWVTGNYGDDTCIAVMQYDMNRNNVVDNVPAPIDGAIHINWSYDTVTVPINVKIVK